MTGKTHDQIALAGSLATSVALRLPIDQTAVMCLGAVAFARAPDYLEDGPLNLWHLPHRHDTHYVPNHIAIALLMALAATLMLPWAYAPIGWAFAGGALLGAALHSHADALTDRGCWLWRRRRQVLLPDALRIRVYTIEKRKHWLTRRETTRKRPSTGERCYLVAATLAVWALAAVQVVLLAHDAFNPPA